ncbi:MAG TPA: hypothetical protein PKA82_16600 [Pyrinomonadaceae bacterium]|nr:hypothetical protein [Pyrinomonadaceae bacterium]
MATSDWMPATLGGKALMFQSIQDNLPGVQAALGMDNAQRERILNLAAEFLNGYEFRSQVIAYDDAMGTWFDQMMNGDGDGNTGGAMPDPPTGPTFNPTNNPVYGVIKEMRKEREAMLVLPGWTKAIGELLMLVKPETPSLNPNDISPSLKAVAASTNYDVAIVVGNRGGMQMYDVDIRRKGGDWTHFATNGGTGATLHIPPTTPGEPEVIEIRVRMRDKNNQPVGNVSETRTVTINP